MGLFSRFKVPSVSAAEAREQITAGAKLVDVRENNEWAAGHPPQAVHMPLASLEAKAARLPKNRPVLVICRSGNRSRTGTKRLRALGYDAYSVSGGMRAWESAGGAVLDRKGRPGRIA